MVQGSCSVSPSFPFLGREEESLPLLPRGSFAPSYVMPFCDATVPDTIIGGSFCRLDPEFSQIDRIKPTVVARYIRDINRKQSLSLIGG